MAAGPSQIVTAVNTSVRIYDKAGNLLSSKSLAQFFKPLGTYPYMTDPVVHYDEYIKRFWLITEIRNDNTNQTGVVIALSNGSDVTSGWSFFFSDMSLDGSNATNNFCDQPRLGFDTQAIYLSCDMWTFPASSASFQYNKVRVMAKSQFLNDTCCNWYDQWNNPLALQPAIMRNAKDSDGEYLVDASAQGSSGDTLDVWHFPDPINNPSEFDQTSVSVSGYYPPPSAAQPKGAALYTGDARLLFAVWQNGSLSTGQTTQCSGLACAAFYELNVSGFPSVSVTNDWALQGSYDYYYPAVDENRSADKTMVYTISSGGQYARPYYLGIPSSSHCTNCVSGSEPGTALGNVGGAQYVNVDQFGRNRWGDYFSASADPDGLGIWMASEYISAPNQWAVEIGSNYKTYAAELKITPAVLNFPDLKIGNTETREVTLKNTGNADLIVKWARIDGSSDYSVKKDECRDSGPLVVGLLQAGKSCVITVEFKPKAAGESKAGLHICDSTQGKCAPNLSGTFGQVGLTGRATK
jgi:hypothetical protein